MQSSFVIRSTIVTLTLALFASGVANGAGIPWPGPPLRVAAARGVVAADHPEASRAGAELLARGGNAVDAAVATALALGVVSPSGSGLGGGGFLVYYNARDQKVRVLDFRETAPARATRDLFLEGGRAVPERSRWGGLAVAVPGEPAGLAELEAKWGKLGLPRAAAPAVQLARSGFAVSEPLARSAARVLEMLGARADGPLRGLLAPAGRPLVRGDQLRAPQLARTLEEFGNRGADALYRGAIAREWVEAVRARGGILDEADLAGYRPIWRAPLQTTYRGRRVYGVPPPAGGATALETLAILEARSPLAALGAGSAASYHQLAEALKHAFADRARRLGDPAFVEVPVAKLLAPAYVRELAARIDADRIHSPESYGGKQPGGTGADVPHDHGTSHLCVVDGEGSVVALTTTINLGFGAALLGGASGVLLNDQMDDFSAQPGVPNAFGLVGGFANAIAPGKRPLSSMTPLVVTEAGRPVLCAGGSGGPLIVSETVQALINVIDFGMDAEAAVSAPRIHAQWMPDVLLAEPEIPADVLDGLRRRGHKVVPPPSFAATAVQLVVIRPDHLEAASDPRKGGTPAAP